MNFADVGAEIRSPPILYLATNVSVSGSAIVPLNPSTITCPAFSSGVKAPSNLSMVFCFCAFCDAYMIMCLPRPGQAVRARWPVRHNFTNRRSAYRLPPLSQAKCHLGSRRGHCLAHPDDGYSPESVMRSVCRRCEARRMKLYKYIPLLRDKPQIYPAKRVARNKADAAY